MVQLYKNIRKRRTELKMTQTELAEKLGYADKSMIAKIEKGQVDLPQSKIMAFANALQISASDLMGWEDSSSIPSYANVFPLDTQSLPVLGKIACGEPIYMNEELEFYTLKGTQIRADFILIAQGDSMTGARINDGDIVFIRKQSTVDNGQIAAVSIGDEATLKRFYFYKEQSMIMLKAANPKYEDLIFVGDQMEKVKILGRAVCFQSDVI